MSRTENVLPFFASSFNRSRIRITSLIESFGVLEDGRNSGGNIFAFRLLFGSIRATMLIFPRIGVLATLRSISGGSSGNGRMLYGPLYKKNAFQKINKK